MSGTRPRRICGLTWPGEYPAFFIRTGQPDDHADDQHECCRPPDHPPWHACKCGEKHD